MAFIRNAEMLASNAIRRDAVAIAEAGYAGVDVSAAFARRLRIEGDTLLADDKAVPLSGRRVFFVGVGKCSVAAAEAIERLLGERLTAGIALDVRHASHSLKKIAVFAGTHPKPTAANTEAAARILDLLAKCAESDLLITVISGGGSTLLCLSDSPSICEDEGILFDALTQKGAAIEELNIVRKHLSKVRGGGMAAAAYPAEVLSLIISDVPGNDLQFIASGPTVKDASTVADAEAVLAGYGVPLPATRLLETPKDSRFFDRVTNILFLTNRDALEPMRREAASLGYLAQIVTDKLCGEARKAAADVLARLRDAPPKSAHLYGGEATVTLPGSGRGAGGRCQEIALAALPGVQAGELVFSFASDGHDASPAAGAIADTEALAHARQKELKLSAFLARHASYEFFAASGDALDTGPLESNVSDLLIALKA